MKALVTADFTDEGLALLRQHAEVIYEPWSRTGKILMAEDLAEKVAELEIDLLVVEVDLVHEEVFEARKLTAVGCCRANPLNVDDETATDEGVPIVFSPGRNAHSVADLSLAFMLNLARGVIGSHNKLTTGQFDPQNMQELTQALTEMRGFELGSVTVGLLGFGAVGRETARRLKGFGSKVIAFDPHVDDAEFEALGAERVDLDKLFTESDVLSLHCALNPKTRGIVSAERIASMKKGAYFINTARHRLVDADALYEALRSGQLAGAGLDVFKAEPPTKDDPFLALPNVIATPHIGGATHDVIRHQSEMIASDIDRILRGELPLHCANPEVFKADTSN